MPERLSSFFQLRVYCEACSLDFEVFDTTKSFPKEEMYALTDQVRRSSRGIGANIAEAWAKRRYPAHFASKLTDADAELQETRHWLSRARAYGYITEQHVGHLEGICSGIGSKLGRMLQHPTLFTDGQNSS